jgi:hypothetical protein
MGNSLDRVDGDRGMKEHPVSKEVPDALGCEFFLSRPGVTITAGT